MSMKKTDLEKNTAKKLDGRMKSGAVPPRFGTGSAQAASKTVEAAKPSGPRLVALSCRLPADLVSRLSEHAASHEGGMSALMTQALEQWLASAPAGK
jgi:hypothetical protein